ncbi:MAG: hypothetical protein WBZ42_10425, partial [Halobacteriota archaeon]
MADKGKEKKRTGLGANPLNWIKDTSETPEETAAPKRKPRTRKAKVQKVEPENVQEVKTQEVQESTISIVQEAANKEVQNEETLELSEMVTQEELEIKPAEEAFLESDPLYRDYKAAHTRVPKYQQLDVKLYVLLRDDQLE